MLSLAKIKSSVTKQLISPVLASICLASMLLLHWLFPAGQLLHFPLNLGLTLFPSGAWLFLGSFSPAVLVAAFWLIADRWYIAYEEQQLLAVFGATYATYQANTPRWI